MTSTTVAEFAAELNKDKANAAGRKPPAPAEGKLTKLVLIVSSTFSDSTVVLDTAL